MKSRLLRTLIIFAFALLLFSLVSAASLSSSSYSNPRYYSSSSSSSFTTPSGFSYQNLISGINAPENQDEFYDLMVTILPGGCKPYVVRSDLLEEQNVPVFCELTAIKINPGVDISKIAKISVKNKDNNPYIAGVGFYPARAAIRSINTLSGSPVQNNIGYAVIVLKRTETENAMPDIINASLSAMFEYDTTNGFGIGVNEMYLPVMSDDEFNNNYKSYGFFNGAGYLRVESMDENSAVVSIYDSQNRRLFGQRLEKDKTSREFRIPTSIYSRSFENQAVTMTLREITQPEVLAKIMVNDNQYMVYKNGKFADKCTLNEVQSTGGGTGSVKVTCGSKSITLEKKFNKIKLNVDGASGDYALGDKISVLNQQVINNSYLVYAGSVPSERVINTIDKITFIFLAKEGNNLITSEKIRTLTLNIDRKIKQIKPSENYLDAIKKLKVSRYDLGILFQNESNNGIKFEKAKFENAFLNSGVGSAGEYYTKAKNGYDDVKAKFPNEINPYISLDNAGETFGTISLWRKYALADELGQKKDALEILSEIKNSYPNSKNTIPDSKRIGDTADKIMAESNNLLSSEGASGYIEDQNLYLELVSVNEPSDSEASVGLTYSGIMVASIDITQSASESPNAEGEGILKVGESFSASSASGFSLKVKEINSTKNATIEYSCNGKSKTSLVIFNTDNQKILDGCPVQITVNKINYQLGSKDNNVSLKIEGRKTLKKGEGIPELFKFSVDSIIKNEDNSFSAKVNFICPGRTGDKTLVIKSEEIGECGITIQDITENSINITYKLSASTSTPKKTSEEISIGTEPMIVRAGEKFIDNSKVQITLKSFTPAKAIFTYICNNSASKDIDIKLGNTEILPNCDNSQIRVDKINLKEVAKVELNPKIRGRIKETNFTFSIGIEKRSDFLLPAPDEMEKKIKDLDETINKWKNTTAKLANLVKGMKAACLATSGALTIKNWATGLTGEAEARHEVMTRAGGWNDICKEAVSKKEYSTAQECLLAKNSEIQASVDETKKLMQDYQTAEKARIKANKNQKGVTDYNKVKEEQLASLKSSYSGEITVTSQDGTQVKKPIGDILKSMNLSEGDASFIDLRELELNLKLMNSNVDESLKKSASKKVNNLLSQFNERAEEHKAIDALNKKLDMPVTVIGNEHTQEYPYYKKTWSQIKEKFSSYPKDKSGMEIIKDTDLVERINSQQPIKVSPSIETTTTQTETPNPVDYLAVLRSPTKTDERINVQQYYKITGVEGSTPKVEIITDLEKNNLPNNFVFKLYDASAYKNPCKNCNYAEIFNSEPYKGMPSLLPFDDKQGWYVSVRQNIASFGNLKSYQDSGALGSFYLCNVGKNGMMEDQMSDDICQGFNINTADTTIEFSGLTASETKTKVNAAINAIRSAQDQLARNPSAEIIIINKIRLNVKGVQGGAGGKCTDFMSPQDCLIMFNVCDPVVCPASRCNMGGAYPVDNVIQSGIIGSILLCLPNIKEKIAIPVCLTGIHAGMESWVSIMQAHRDCLNESLATNKTVGICDEIYSVYQCDFMWKQVGPFVNVFAKNALSGNLFGAGTRGGGEYMFVNSAFNNMENSWQYFTKSYASDSSLSFGSRSFSDIGSEVCKAKISATYPDDFGAILEPDSPVQIYAFFDEMKYTDATVPATSQYKVYYHIFAGNDRGHYYSVYLKDSTVSFGTISRGYSSVASGYIAKGETIDQTKDFLDNSGFKQLCVRIDTKDYCGFKSVTTDFAINYAKDKALQDQSTNSVTTERECVSGSPSVGALLTPNIQQGVEGVISPDLYNQGIVRVCATRNPGESVDATRWKEVGYCDQTNIKCWIDQNSVKNAIKGQGIENQTLKDIDALSVKQMIAEGKMPKEAGDNVISGGIDGKGGIINKYRDAKTMADVINLEKDVDVIYPNLIFSSQKAALLYFKAQVYDRIARALGKKDVVPVNPQPTVAPIGSSYNYQSADGFIYKGNVKTKFYYKESDKIIYYQPDYNLIGTIGNYFFNTEYLVYNTLTKSDIQAGLTGINTFEGSNAAVEIAVLDKIIVDVKSNTNFFGSNLASSSGSDSSAAEKQCLIEAYWVLDQQGKQKLEENSKTNSNEVYVILKLKNTCEIPDLDKYFLTINFNDEALPKLSLDIANDFLNNKNLDSSYYYKYSPGNAGTYKLKIMKSSETIKETKFVYQSTIVSTEETTGNKCIGDMFISKDAVGNEIVEQGETITQSFVYVFFDFIATTASDCDGYWVGVRTGGKSTEKIMEIKNLISEEKDSFTNNFADSGNYTFEVFDSSNNIIKGRTITYTKQASFVLNEPTSESWKTYTLENDFNIASRVKNRIFKDGVDTGIYLLGNTIKRSRTLWDVGIGNIDGGDTLNIVERETNNKYPELNNGVIIYKKYIQIKSSISS